MKLNSFSELFLFLLSDIYAVENQIVAELPKIIQKTDSEELHKALKQHLVETKEQIKRLDKIFKLIDDKPLKVEYTSDIKSLFVDTDKFLKSNSPSPLLDAAIIVIAQRIEHFEIATYGSLKEFANVLELDEVEKIIKESLKEECDADNTLTKLAKGGVFKSGINSEAISKAA